MKNRLEQVVQYLRLETVIAIAYLRARLSELYRHPWFPRRKVLAGALATLIGGYLSTKLGGLSPEMTVVIAGASGSFVGWLIPER